MAHSYSSVKDFEGCPKRYHAVRIVKRFKNQDTEATLYGTAVHKAFEEYVRDKTPLPEQFGQFQPFVEPLATLAETSGAKKNWGSDATLAPAPSSIQMFGSGASQTIWLSIGPKAWPVSLITKQARAAGTPTWRSWS
jgi:hypothetical protein